MSILFNRSSRASTALDTGDFFMWANLLQKLKPKQELEQAKG